MHARRRIADRRVNIIAIARPFVLTNAPRANYSQFSIASCRPCAAVCWTILLLLLNTTVLTVRKVAAAVCCLLALIRLRKLTSEIILCVLSLHLHFTILYAKSSTNHWQNIPAARRSSRRAAAVGFTAVISFFLSFFVSDPLSSHNGTQPKLTACSEVSQIWKCISKIWVGPFR